MFKLRLKTQAFILMAVLSFAHRLFAGEAISCKEAVNRVKSALIQYKEMTNEELPQVFVEISTLLGQIDEQIRYHSTSLVVDQDLFKRTYSLIDRLNPKNKNRKNDLKKIEETIVAKQSLEGLRRELLALQEDLKKWTELDSKVKDIEKFKYHLQTPWGALPALLMQTKIQFEIPYEKSRDYLLKLASKIQSNNLNSLAILALGGLISGKSVEEVAQLHYEVYYNYQGRYCHENPALVTQAALISGMPVSEVVETIRTIRDKYIYSDTYAIASLAVITTATRKPTEEILSTVLRVSTELNSHYGSAERNLSLLLLLTGESLEKIVTTYKQALSKFKPEELSGNFLVLTAITTASILTGQTVDKVYEDYKSIRPNLETPDRGTASMFLILKLENLSPANKRIAALMASNIIDMSGHSFFQEKIK